MHGNKPSRGAEIDADLAREDAELIAKKKGKTDSMPGKKLEHHTQKSEWKQEIEREGKEAQARYRDEGRNTHEGQGMQYVTRKTHSSRDE
jgi:flagellar capping protein FliD